MNDIWEIVQKPYWITWSMDMWCEVGYINTTIARAKPIIWNRFECTRYVHVSTLEFLDPKIF
jgi:hypothetical protein